MKLLPRLLWEAKLLSLVVESKLIDTVLKTEHWLTCGKSSVTSHSHLWWREQMYTMSWLTFHHLPKM